MIKGDALKELDYKKIDMLLQYILAAAAQNDYYARELGPIHLIKYVYLVDLAYAERHNGETFTGINWQFYHYGPWSLDLFNRIEPALQQIKANKKVIQTDKFDGDMIRWSLTSDRLYEQLEKKFDLSVNASVQKYVKMFGADTESLLHFVYSTSPMVNAAPKDFLDFKNAIPQKNVNNVEAVQRNEPTAKQKKNRKKDVEALRAKLQAHVAKKLSEKQSRMNYAQPRYDEVYEKGIEYLDSLAGPSIKEDNYTVTVSDEYWKSKSRFDPELP